MENIPKEDLNMTFSKLNLKKANPQNGGGAPNNGTSEGSNSIDVDEITEPIDISDVRNEKENLSNDCLNIFNVYTTNGFGNNNRSILELNDLDFILIAYKLKLESKLKLANTCRRLYIVTQSAMTIQYFNLNFQDVYHCDFLLEDFFPLVGPGVTSYLSKGTYGSFTLRDYYSHFTALRTIRFRKHDLDPGYLPELLPNMAYITKLYFYRCEFDDEDSYAFSELPNLTHLSIVENDEILGHHIYLCAKLVELRLRKCKAVEVSNFANFCYNLKHLETLDVVDCCEVAYEEVFYNLRSLRKISLSCKLDRINYEMLADMPLISDIEIACYKVDLTERLLHALLKTKIVDLLSLKITYPKKIGVSLKHQSFLVSQFANLRELSWRSRHYDDIYFYRNIVEKMTYLHKVSLVGVGEFSALEFENMITLCPFLNQVDVRFCDFVTNEYILEALYSLELRQEVQQLALETYFQEKYMQKMQGQQEQQQTLEEGGHQQERKELQEQLQSQESQQKPQFVPTLKIMYCIFLVFGSSVTEDIVNNPEFEDSKEYIYLDFTNTMCQEESDSEGEGDAEGEDWLEDDDYYYISDLYPDIY